MDEFLLLAQGSKLKGTITSVELFFSSGACRKKEKHNQQGPEKRLGLCIRKWQHTIFFLFNLA